MRFFFEGVLAKSTVAQSGATDKTNNEGRREGSIRNERYEDLPREAKEEDEDERQQLNKAIGEAGVCVCVSVCVTPITAHFKAMTVCVCSAVCVHNVFDESSSTPHSVLADRLFFHLS